MDNIKVWKTIVIVGAVIILILGYLLVTMEPSEQRSKTAPTGSASTDSSVEVENI